MQSPVTNPFANRLLAALPPDELSLLRPHLVRSNMVNGQSLHEPGERIDQVYFFEHGFTSLVADPTNEGTGVEVGISGWDGMVGLGILLNPAAVAFNQSIVQYPGVAYRMPAAALLACLGRMPVLHGLLLRALEFHLAQVSQTAACNSRHPVAQRCARWLLIAHDRVEGDELRLTQEFLSMMLAVRRSGVTLAIHSLQRAGLVRTGRGRILVCDRPGLEAAACGCYARVRAFGAPLPVPIALAG